MQCRARLWVRRGKKIGPPTYSDSTTVAQANVKAAPERLVWGSDWPHPSGTDNAKPDDAILFDLLAWWAPVETVRAQPHSGGQFGDPIRLLVVQRRAWTFWGAPHVRDVGVAGSNPATPITKSITY